MDKYRNYHIAIFVAAHKPDFVIHDEVHTPIHVGRANYVRRKRAEGRNGHKMNFFLHLLPMYLVTIQRLGYSLNDVIKQNSEHL